MTIQGKQDAQTVTPEGNRVMMLIEGVKVRYLVTQVDDRGTLTEIFNPAWEFHPDPLVYVYQFTIRPNKVKGWVVHQEQDDRIFLSSGSVKIVLFDGRPESITYQMINEVYLSDHNRGLITFPKGVYHAVQNIGLTDATLLNLPTQPYRHANPDKYRLSIDTGAIPYSFDISKPGR
jgi:dTDP-4-dehydrorhamnose 3,5-epimerase